MSKPIVPVLAFLVVLGVALLMIAGIVVRPWELPQARQVSLASSSAYGRSMLSYVGSDSNIGWQHPAQIEPAGNGIGGQPPISGDHYSGRDYFISYGCASCHGLNGQGTRWAPMRVTAPEQVHMMVRIGPGGMPAYSKDYLPDSTVDLMAGWLVEAAASKPAPPPTALSTPPATSTPPPPQPPATSTVAAPVSTPPATGTTVPPQTTTPAPAAPATPAGNIETGERIYSDLGCSGCHAKGGKGTAFAPALVGPAFADKYKTDPALAELMRKGKGMMPAYGSSKLSDQGLADLIAYLRSLDR